MEESLSLRGAIAEAKFVCDRVDIRDLFPADTGVCRGLHL